MVKFYIILAIFCQSVQRVCGAHLRVIAPADNTATFEEMLQQQRTVGNIVSIWPSQVLNRRPPVPKTNALDHLAGTYTALAIVGNAFVTLMR